MQKYCTQIGKTQRPHGLKGEVKVFVEEPYMDDFLEMKTIFLQIRGQLVPYFVEYVRGSNANLLKLEDVNTREDALLVAGKPLYAHNEALSVSEEDLRDQTFFRFEQYTVFDQDKNCIGIIESVVESPFQALAALSYHGKEVMLPLHEDLILGYDDIAKTIILHLPEGILDL